MFHPKIFLSRHPRCCSDVRADHFLVVSFHFLLFFVGLFCGYIVTSVPHVRTHIKEIPNLS